MADPTLLELSTLSLDVDDALPAQGSLITLPDGSTWKVIQISTSSVYTGIAYQNQSTPGQIVIANRGTDPTHLSDLLTDAEIAAQQATPAALSAQIFAQQVATNNRGATIVETGNSLGGYDAATATARLVDLGADVTASAVTFNAPGLAANTTLFANQSSPTSYPVLNLYNQGDIVHLAGGTHLGASYSIAAGPSGATELATAAASFLGAVFGPLVSLAFGGLLTKELLTAHSIQTAINYLSPTGLGSEFGGETATQFIDANQGGGPDANITAEGQTFDFSNSSGDSYSITAEPGATTLSASAVVGSDGLLAPSDEAAAINAEMTADGAGDVNENVNNQIISQLESSSTLDAAADLSSTGSVGIAVAQSAANLWPGASNAVFSSDDTPGSRIEFNVPASGTATETVIANSGDGSVWVGSAAGLGQLEGGTNPVSGQADSWTDNNGTQYSFSGEPDSETGTLTISKGVLGSGNSIIIQNFNLAAAGSSSGFLGIQLPGEASVTAEATTGTDPPALFPAGSEQSYTFSVDVPSTTAQTITLTLSGASPSDFQAAVGNQVIPLSANGTFTVTLSAGETNVSFGLIDVTEDTGSSDIADGATLQLSASLPNPANANGSPIQSAPLSITYAPETTDTSTAPQTDSVITGQTESGYTLYQGDGLDDSIAAGAGPNLIQASDSGSDSIIGGSGSNTVYGGSGNDVISLNGSQDLVLLGDGFSTLSGSASGDDTIYANGGDGIVSGNGGTDLIFGGDGTSQIYAGAAVNLQTAITQALSATATGHLGDLLSVLDGDNTIVSGDGNDLVTAGTGNDVIVLGPGNDTFDGGIEVTSGLANWSTTLTSNLLTLNNVTGTVEPFVNPYLQPYNGDMTVPNNGPIGPGNDTIFAGNGNDYIFLPNGDNLVEVGSGADSIWGGMGNDTVVAGSGADLIQGGGGSEYIYGGSGADSLFGGDGNNTIIGGSGNATIESATYGSGSTWAGESLEQNYVTGGSGNDVIDGSGGNDTLIGGTGNDTIYGGSGNENIVGGSGNDLLIGGSGNDTIVAGGSGRDTLQAQGTSSSTTLIYGGIGSDTIYSDAGTDVIYAGDGGTASNPTQVNVNPTDSTATTTVYGGAGVDEILGGAGTAVLYAGDGGTSAAPASVFAGAGDTTIYGGLGTDVLEGGAGTDVLYAGDGGTSSAPVSMEGGTGASTLYGGAGPGLLQDTLSGQDLLVAGTSNDTLIGIGNDTLTAGPGNDNLQANSGSVTFDINAGFGNATVHNNLGAATENLNFGTGIDPTDLSGGIGVDAQGQWYLTLSGDGGSVSDENGLTGGLSSVDFADSGPLSVASLLDDVFSGDQVVADGSRNFFLTLGSDESLTTGEYGDTVASWGNDDTVTGDNFTGLSQIYVAGTGSSVTGGLYNEITAAGSNDSVTGSEGNLITVSGANDVATAGTYNDTLTAAGTDDTLIGGSGNSLFYVNNATAVIEEPDGGGSDAVDASVSYTLPTNVTYMRLTGSANIVGTGNSASDSLMGGAGNDTLVAGSGVDTLYGGTGNTTFVVNNQSDVVSPYGTGDTVEASVSYTAPNQVAVLELTGTANLTGTADGDTDTLVSNSGVDTLVSGGGNDTFVLNNASDVVQYSTAGSASVIDTAFSYTLPTNVNTLVLGGTGNLTGTANTGTDTLISNSGTDTLVGGSGKDTFVINNAGDVIQDTSTTESNAVQASVSYTLPTNVNTLTLTGSGNLVGAGNTASDVITANSGADTLVAGTGVATLTGGVGGDTFVVNSSGDHVQQSNTGTSNVLEASVSFTLPTNVNTIVLTGSGNLTATGNAGNDSMVGDAGTDTLTAGAGTDTLVAGSGLATLKGGAGNDLFVANNTADVVQNSSTTNSDTVQSSATFTLPTNVNSLVLTGSSAIAGTTNSGNDAIYGNAGSDTLSATSGTDTLVAGTGVDTLIAGTGNDSFVVDNAADAVSVGGTHGQDSVESSVSYTAPANISALILTGSANLSGTGNGTTSDSVIGNAGNDTLFAGAGRDTLIAGSGPATLVGSSAGTVFVINNAADVIESVSGGVNNVLVSSVNATLPTNIDTLELSGNASLVGTGNNDAANVLMAGSGADTLISGSGTTQFDGGVGNDAFVVNNASDNIEAVASAINTAESSVSYSLPNYVTTLLLTGSSNLTGTGNTLADSLVGNAGNDTLSAGVGNDTLVAGGGVTTLVGGVGNDTFVIDNSGDVVTGQVSGQNNTLISSVNATLPTNINTLLLSGSGNLVGSANGANDSIAGNLGTDTLIAGAGNDTLEAGAGVDTLEGGAGNDTFIVNNAADVVQNASASSTNALVTSVSYTLPTNVNVLTLAGPSSIAGTGNAGNDTLTAGTGNDTLYAGSGVATLIGGTGDGTFVVNNTADVVQDVSTATSNTIDSSVSYSLATNVNTLVLTGTAALSGTANAGNDTLSSNVGVDTLVGGSGTDTFIVGNAADVVEDTSTAASNTIEASVSYSLSTNVNTLELTGTAALTGTDNGGSDTLASNAGVDTLVGGAGNDTFIVNNAGDVVQDSSTTTTNTVLALVSYTLPTNVNVLTLTGSGNVSASGNAANDVITANTGNDTLISGSGVDTLIGGSGNDAFIVNNASEVVEDSSTSAADVIESSVSYSLSTNIEDLTLTGTGNLVGTANGGADTLTSNSGIDTLAGGSGNDVFVVNNAADVILNAHAGDTVESSANFSLPTNITYLALAGTAAISGTGNGSSDTLVGGAGADTLIAGTGVATLVGGAGNTTFVVNNASDVIQDTVTGTSNSVQSSVSYTVPTNVDTLALTGTAALSATGNEDADNTLTGNSGNDVLSGTAYSTTINGGAGADTLNAGPVLNLIYAGTGGTTSSPTYVYGNSGDTSPITESTIYGGAGVDVLDGGPGSDLIVAGSGTATLNAGTGFDSLYGSGGSLVTDTLGGQDLLVAGAGAETLEGTGADTLVAGSGTDLLYDATGAGSTGEFVVNAGFGHETIGTTSGSQDDNLYFGSGINPGDFTATAAQTSDLGTQNDISLILSGDGGSISIPGGLVPGTVGSIDFAAAGAETLTQLMNADGRGTVVVPYESASNILSTGNDQTVTAADYSGYWIWTFGNDDSVNGGTLTEYIYGNSTTVTGGPAWAGGADDLVMGAATLAGANDTAIGAGNFTVEQSSDVVEATGSSNTVYASASYSLPNNVQTLYLSGNDVSASSNSVGGSLTADGSGDTLTGGAGTDTLVADGSNDLLVGGSGVETYVLTSPTDSIQFGSGNASVTTVEVSFDYTLTGAANTLVEQGDDFVAEGNNASDSLVADGNGDTLVAGSGADTLVGYSATTLVGGTGNDTFVINDSADVIVDTSTTSADSVEAGVSYSLPTFANALTLTGQNETGTANSGNDVITATGLEDTLVAGSGNDTLVGDRSPTFDLSGYSNTFVLNSGFGSDDIVAQVGDVVDFGSGISEGSLSFSAIGGTAGSAGSLVISEAGGGSVTLQGALQPALATTLEFTGGSTLTVPQALGLGQETVTGPSGNLILSDDNDASMTGGTGQDTIDTWGSGDTLTAGSGGAAMYAGGSDDVVNGGSGTDSLVAIGSDATLIGGSGNESFFIDDGTGSAVVQVSPGVGADTVYSSVSYTVPTNVSVMEMTGVSGVTAAANNGNDLIIANTGNDYLASGTGVDTLIGGGGGDVFYVQNSSDVVEESSSTSNDTLETSVSYSLPVNVNTLELSSLANITGTGNAGNDFIEGSYGNDVLTAGSGNDTLEALFDAYDPNVSTLVGGAGADSLYGGPANYADLVSGSGVDTLVASYAGSVAINNSADVLQLEYANYSSDLTVLTSVNYAFAAGIADNGGIGAEAFIDWSLTGDGNLVADAGLNDGYFTITGNAGSDTLEGGSGSNKLVGGTGVDTLIGGGSGSSNTFVITNAADVVSLQGGSTNVAQSYASYTLPTGLDVLTLATAGIAGTGNSDTADTLQAYGGDTLVAGSGADLLISATGDGVNTLVAGSGSDTLSAYAGDTLLFDSGFGNSQVSIGSGGSGTPTVEFGAGISASSLTVSAVLDVNGDAALAISSGAEAITLNGAMSGTGYQFELAGGGTLTLAQFLSEVNVDTSSVAGSSGNVILEATPTVSVAGGSGKDTIYAVGANDTVVAGSGNQTLDVLGTDDSVTGGAGADTLSGLGTNDTVVAGSAANTLVGGTGATVEFVVNNTSDVVRLQSSPGSDTISSSVAYTLPTNVNTLVLTGTAALKGTANSGNDTLTSNTGQDTLVGGATSSSNDLFTVNSALDSISVGSTHGTDTIESSVSFTASSNVADLALIGTASLSGTGNSLANVLTANSGSDTLTAGTGAATMNGGGGNNLFVINSASDVVSETHSSASDTISSSVSYTLPTDVNSLVLIGTASLAGTANTGNDTLTSNTGKDTLVAGTLSSSNDVLVVNNATDVLTIGATHGTDTVQSSVSYTLPTTVNVLLLSGTASLVGTANTGNDTLTSNTGKDTLVAGTLSSSNDLLVVNNATDVLTIGATHGTDTIQSSVSYTLPTTVNVLLLSGTASLVGTANTGNDTLTSNTGKDTLVAGTSSSSNDVLIVNNASDVVTVGSTHGTDTVQSSVTYTAPTNVADLTLIGTGSIGATGNSLANVLTANSGSDTLTAGSGAATMDGGTGNDVFVINSASDVVQDTYTTTSDTVQSSVNYTLPTNVNVLLLSGTASLVGTANTGNDTLTSNTGKDTLVAGTLSSSNDLLVVNNATDVLTIGATHGTDTIQSSVSYTLPTTVNVLTLTGTSALIGMANGGADVLTANSGADTLKAGAGADTLVSGSGVDSLVAGSGTDVFEVNNASDVVTVSTTGNDSVQSSVNYTLPNDVQYLMLTGTGALTGTGNSLTDLIVGNTGNDTLKGGTGIAVLEGGKTAGQDVLQASSNQAALIGGGGSSTLTGGAYKDFFAAGSVSDSITTGATDNVVSANKGDGTDTLDPTSGATNDLSLGGGIDTENLTFSKSGNNLVLNDGVSADSITFENWYSGSSDQNYTTLQVVEIASPDYNSSGSDPLRNEALEEFNFSTLVTAFNNAGSPSNWALSNDMASAQLTGSSTAAYGGDLAYYFGLNGNLTGMDLSAAQSTLTNASYATGMQTIDSWSSISGGPIELLAKKPVTSLPDAPLTEPKLSETRGPELGASRLGSSTDVVTSVGTKLEAPTGVDLPVMQLPTVKVPQTYVWPELPVPKLEPGPRLPANNVPQWLPLNPEPAPIMPELGGTKPRPLLGLPEGRMQEERPEIALAMTQVPRDSGDAAADDGVLSTTPESWHGLSASSLDAVLKRSRGAEARPIPSESADGDLAYGSLVGIRDVSVAARWQLMHQRLDTLTATGELKAAEAEEEYSAASDLATAALAAAPYWRVPESRRGAGGPR